MQSVQQQRDSNILKGFTGVVQTQVNALRNSMEDVYEKQHSEWQDLFNKEARTDALDEDINSQTLKIIEAFYSAQETVLQDIQTEMQGIWKTEHDELSSHNDHVINSLEMLLNKHRSGICSSIHNQEQISTDNDSTWKELQFSINGNQQTTERTMKREMNMTIMK